MSERRKETEAKTGRKRLSSREWAFNWPDPDRERRRKEQERVRRMEKEAFEQLQGEKNLKEGQS